MAKHCRKRNLVCTRGVKPRQETEKGASVCRWWLDREFEDSIHLQPFFTGVRARQGLLKLPHQVFPLLNFRIFTIGFGFGFEREGVVHLDHHEEARGEEIDFHALDARGFESARYLRPDLLMVALVLGYERGIV